MVTQWFETFFGVFLGDAVLTYLLIVILIICSVTAVAIYDRMGV